MKQIATALSLMLITGLSAMANTPIKTEPSSSSSAQITKSPTKEVQRTRRVKKLHKKAASNAVAPAAKAK